MTDVTEKGSDFIRDLGDAARRNPVSAALIGMGLVWLFAGKSAVMPSVDFTESQRAILAALDGEPCEVEEIIERTGLAAQIVLQDLTLLSLRGQVSRVDGRKYVRRR